MPVAAFQVETGKPVSEMTHTTTEIGAKRRRAEPFPPIRTLPAEASRLFAPRRCRARFAAHGLRIESPVFGRAVDVSPRGLRIESPAQLAVGAGYVFRLNHGCRSLHLRGRVAWSRLDRFEATRAGNRPVFQAGIELEPGQETPPAPPARVVTIAEPLA